MDLTFFFYVCKCLDFLGKLFMILPKWKIRISYEQTAFWLVDSKDLTHFNFFTYQWESFFFSFFRLQTVIICSTGILVMTAKIQNIYLATRRFFSSFSLNHYLNALEIRLIDGQVKLENEERSRKQPSLRKIWIFFVHSINNFFSVSAS